MKKDHKVEITEYQICPKKKAYWDHYLSTSPTHFGHPIFIYQIPPIDDWTAFQRFEAFARETEDEFCGMGLLNDVHVQLDRAMRLARDFGGWEGDIKAGPYVCPDLDIKGDGYPYVNMVWKQNNNGDTFIASNRLLSYLEDNLVCSLINNEIQSFGPNYGFENHSKQGH